MVKKNMQAIILAAGKSTRFKSEKTKLLEKICGQAMILYPTKMLEKLTIATTVVVGHQKEEIMQTIEKHHGENIQFVVQKQQAGTGHALLYTQDTWENDHILIMNGDMPLAEPEIIENLIEQHIQKNATISFVTAHNADPTCGAYGRVITEGDHIRIVEAQDFEGDPTEHCCINAGIYVVTKQFLQKHSNSLNTHNKAQEFYLTDLIKIASDEELTVHTLNASFDRVRGINTFQELWAAEQIKRADIIKYWMENGVRFSVAQNTHISLDATIGSGSYIGCGVHILGNTTIGKNCYISEFSAINNSTIGDNTTIYPHCVINKSSIGSQAYIGPFAHIRPESCIHDGVTIGNFVEVKKSTIDEQTKVKHLSYIGDTTIGKNVNIGAGTITCNHNSVSKQPTTIENNAYIGSNTTLVAPVTIKEGAYTGAGSVITKDVPEDALALGRARQINKAHYATKLKQKLAEQESEQKETKTHSQKNSFMAAIKTSTDSLHEGS